MSETSEIYVPIEWLNHIIERPRTYTIMNNDDGTVTLTPAFGEIKQNGTPVNAENLNHMEQGIIDAIRAAVNAMARANAGVNAAAKANEAAANAAAAASAAQTTANTGVSNAAAAQTAADGKIPKVSGATEGHIPTFKSDGTLASSGIAMSSFHRCKYTLSGTTLMITTVS